ncbi:uncharacterized protein LOC131687786 [Topomyia yanbarensis]|uniref:uncharacterized protein LOC131687786 n=1 Tax=Topomyia yanbarensis TaxID=2498891 RepID=UPI00273BCBBB|nr:uncharacterized protein LOC131687786 [Topomyia yanbarensis]
MVVVNLDTASDITVISQQIWKKIGSPRLSPATVNAKAASGNILPLDGEFNCDITIGENTRTQITRVTEKPLHLLRSDLVDSFNLWSIPMDTFCCQVTSTPSTSATLKATYPKVFSKKPKVFSKKLYNRTKIKFEVKEQCKSVFCAKRPVAYAMYSAVDQELDKLEKLNIITPVDYSEWAAPIVVVRKANGNIRICGDYSTGLNSALQPHQYPLPLPEDIFAKLANCKIFKQIDPVKVEAITTLPPPTDVSGVSSFLGAINYYGKFVPNMRQLRYPLDNLLKSEAKFVWNQECQQAFERFKQILSSGLRLTHYDPKQEIIVSADASSVGLGATISHKFPDGSIKVVQHASRALKKTEQNCSQPDRKGLAIIFAVTKFQKMIFGRKFRLQTDHDPLLQIFGSKKGIPVYTANRVQRFALNLLSYDFDIRCSNADVLSRLINQHVKPEEDSVIASIILEKDVRVVAKSTQADPLLRSLPVHTRRLAFIKSRRSGG